MRPFFNFQFRTNSKGRSKRVHMMSRSAGFTLIEMLVVLSIIGLIVSLTGPRILGYLADSKVKTARIQTQNLASAVDLFFMDNGRYPTASEGLTALVDKPSDTDSWNGPYLKGAKVPNDPWGRPFAYQIPGKQGPYEITSLGPNGTMASGASVAPSPSSRQE